MSIIQQEKLSKLINPSYGDVYLYNEKPLVIDEFDSKRADFMSYMKGMCLPLLSIGQCLELLEERGLRYREVLYGGFDEYDTPELIDALWQAVKQVL